MKKTKKKNKRSKAKYPNLDKGLNLKSRTEVLDYDYLDKLSPENLAYLNKFSGEHYNAAFDDDGLQYNVKDELKAARKVTKTLKKALDAKAKEDEKRLSKIYENMIDSVNEHQVALEKKRDAEERNNARNRCDYTRAKAFDMVESIDTLKSTPAVESTFDFDDQKVDNLINVWTDQCDAQGFKISMDREAYLLLREQIKEFIEEMSRRMVRYIG